MSAPRTPEEIYEEIAATPGWDVRFSADGTAADKLAWAESRVAYYQRAEELWQELARGLLERIGEIPRWQYAAAVGAAGEMFERRLGAQDRVELYRRRAEAES